MKKLAIGYGALTGALLTAPLIALLFLARELAELPFPPYDLFDWMARVLPGALVTFGIDRMVDTLTLLGVSVADTAKTAEKLAAVILMFLMGVAGGAVFFAVFALRRARPDIAGGLIAGAMAGLPMAAISVAIEGSTINPLLVILWTVAVFLAWGWALREAYLRVIPAPSEHHPEGAQPASTIGRRQFLVRVGTATAVITVASTGLGTLLAGRARRRSRPPPRPWPTKRSPPTRGCPSRTPETP